MRHWVSVSYDKQNKTEHNTIGGKFYRIESNVFIIKYIDL